MRIRGISWFMSFVWMVVRGGLPLSPSPPLLVCLFLSLGGVVRGMLLSLTYSYTYYTPQALSRPIPQTMVLWSGSTSKYRAPNWGAPFLAIFEIVAI